MDLLTYIRHQLDDVATPYRFSDELLLEYLKDGVVEASLRANWFIESTATVAVAANDETVLLPKGTLRLTGATYQVTGGTPYQLTLIDDRMLTRLDPDWRNRAAGQPEYLNVDATGGTGYLVPPAADTATLTLRGHFRPDFDIEDFDLEDRDKWTRKIPVPIAHWKDLAQWVFYCAYDRFDADSYAPQKALTHLARFEAAFGPKPTANVVEYRRRGKPGRSKAHFV